MKLSLERVSQILARSLNISVDELFDAFYVAKETDFDDVVRFRREYFRNFHGWDDRAYLRWRFDFSADSSGTANAFWILRVNGEILGVIGVESFGLMVNGRIMQACHPSELLAKPELNGLGIGAWLSMAITRKCPILMVVGSTGESLNLIKRLFHPMSNYETWKLPVSLKGTLYRVTRSRLLASVAALMLDTVMRIRRRFCLSRYLDPAFSARPIERFTDEIDGWAKHFSRARIFRHRSSRYLNWRFLDNPRQQYRALGIYQGNTLVAYSIYHLMHSSQNDQLEANIADFFWNDKVQAAGANETLKRTLALTIQTLIKQGVKLIELKLIARDLSEDLSQLGFRQRGTSDIFAVMISDPELPGDLEENRLWLLTSADAHDDGL